MSKAAKVGTMLATGAVTLAVAGAGNAVTPKKTIPFTATYAGTATVQVNDQVADITANGKGTGTVIGSSGPRLHRSREPSIPVLPDFELTPPLAGNRASGSTHHVTSSACVAGFITLATISSVSPSSFNASRAPCAIGFGVTDSIGSTTE